MIARVLSERGWTLAVAESITGGGIGARLITVPGASGWFAGGVITYATTTKTVLADVPPALLDAPGPVSEEVAVAMARGIGARLGTDVALGAVGVAGPTVQGGRDVGTVCVGAVLAGGDTDVITRTLGTGTRVDVQRRAVDAALTFLVQVLTADEP